MKKNSFYFILFSFLLVSFFTQCKRNDVTINGVVTYKDLLTGQEKIASGADVFLMVNDTEYVTKTVADENGEYMFYPVDNGTYHVAVEYEGTLFTYTGRSDDFTVKGDDVMEVDVTAQITQNTIYGQVTAEIDGETYVLQDLEVDLYKAGENTVYKSVTTDDNGNYSFVDIPDGKYDVDAYYEDDNGNGYYDLVENVSVSNGNAVKVNLNLTKDKKRE